MLLKQELSANYKKRPLVVWSGGFDSTLCLIKTLVECKEVDTVYVDLMNNPLKSEKERSARDIIKGKIATNFPEFNILNDHVIKMPQVHAHLTNAQPFLWFNLIPMVFNPEIHSCVVFGYIAKDDFWKIKSQAEKVFQESSILRSINVYESVLELKSINISEKVNFVYPLAFKSKKEVLNFIEHTEYKDIMYECITCENNEENMVNLYRNHCGECNTCSSSIEILEYYKNYTCREDRKYTFDNSKLFKDTSGIDFTPDEIEIMKKAILDYETSKLKSQDSRNNLRQRLSDLSLRSKKYVASVEDEQANLANYDLSKNIKDNLGNLSLDSSLEGYGFGTVSKNQETYKLKEPHVYDSHNIEIQNKGLGDFSWK